MIDVGQGFDAGKLTRGNNTYHCSVVIPWEISDWPIEFMWNHVNIQDIDSYTYCLSRQRRIDVLKSMGYSKTELENCIPSESLPKIDKNLFRSIFEKYINKLIKCKRDFNIKHPTVIMANIYGKKIHVVEIWNSEL